MRNSPVVYKKAASPTGLICLRRLSFQAKLPTEEEFKSHALVVVIKRETDKKNWYFERKSVLMTYFLSSNISKMPLKHLISIKTPHLTLLFSRELF